MLPNLLFLLCHQKLFYLLSASIRSPSKSSNLTYLCTLFFSAHSLQLQLPLITCFYIPVHHFRLQVFHINIHGLSKLAILSTPFDGCLQFQLPAWICHISPWKISVAFHNSSSAWTTNLFLIYQPYYSFASFSLLCNLCNQLLFSEIYYKPSGIQSNSVWLWKCLFYQLQNVV